VLAAESADIDAEGASSALAPSSPGIIVTGVPAARKRRIDRSAGPVAPRGRDIIDDDNAR
jgi:hypothetical protein